MIKADYPVLCGGTFFTLVLLARKPGTSSRGHTNGEKNNFKEKDVLRALAKIAIPELENDISPSGCSEFKSCKKGLLAVGKTNPQYEYCEAFDERVKNQYTSVLDAMKELVEEYISTNSHVQTGCARRLLDLICKDDSIQHNEIFYTNEHGQALKKDALDGAKLDIYLPALLLGIWHFVVVHRENNTLGAATFENWHRRSSSDSRSRWVFISKIGDAYNGEIRILSERPENSVASGPLESSAGDNTSQSGTPDDADIHIPQSGTAEISVPQGCRICLCCKDWQGQVGRALLALDGIYGGCDALDKRTLSTGSCDQFRPDYGKISQYQMSSIIPKIWKK